MIIGLLTEKKTVCGCTITASLTSFAGFNPAILYLHSSPETSLPHSPPPPPPSPPTYLTVSRTALQITKSCFRASIEIIIIIDKQVQGQLNTMASIFRRVYDWLLRLFWATEMDITMIGLQNAGKTSLLRVLAVSSPFTYSSFFWLICKLLPLAQTLTIMLIYRAENLHLSTIIPFLPIQDNLYKSSYRNLYFIEAGFADSWTPRHVTLKCWDLGGQPRFRSMWERYCRGVNAIVFIVDSADPDALPIAKDELHLLLEKPVLQGIPLLVLGNKSDLENKLSVDELIERLDLKSVGNREVSCYGISAKEETNLDAVLQWLVARANK
ncbi:hypothetical protein EYC84_003857 [Monilinia fructicola]|uniref:ADP-ribosylation factor-like protein 8B n=1 Tax=Monilinia fructicola TaxID=38448 RepID=A0A5M9JZ14_MONFR|nr:hypothetical protein EYC84_003857 [Monilinia fructicola]